MFGFCELVVDIGDKLLFLILLTFTFSIIFGIEVSDEADEFWRKLLLALLLLLFKDVLYSGRVGDGAERPLANWELDKTGLLVGVVLPLLPPLPVKISIDGMDRPIMSIGVDKIVFVDDDELDVDLILFEMALSFWNNLSMFVIIEVAFLFNCSRLVGVNEQDRSGSSFKDELDESEIIDWFGLK